MLQDERTKAEKMVGLLGIDGYMQKELAANPPPAMRPNAESPRPLSMLEQMDERHGKLKSRLGLFSHLYNGGSRSDYGDEDMLAAQKATQAQDALTQKMGLLQPYVSGLSSDDPQEQARSMLALSQAGVSEDMMGMLAPSIAQQFNTPTYTKGSYEKIDGVWQLVQQADDGSIKYTKMDRDFTPSSRMMSGDKVQEGLQEYQEASFGAAQNIESIDGVLSVMDEVGEEAWTAGLKGEVSEAWKELTGTQDPVSMARKQYEGIKTTRAIQNLPPGVASDKDIELVLKPFPTSFTNYEELQDYLRKLKRGEQKIQEYNNFSARYLSNSGMRDGMIDAWDEHWDQMTSEGGRFYEEPKQKSTASQTPASQLPVGIARPNPDGSVNSMDDEIEGILQGLGI